MQALAQTERGAFELRGGNAAPAPAVIGNEVPGGQPGIQVEPRVATEAARPEPKQSVWGVFYFL